MSTVHAPVTAQVLSGVFTVIWKPGLNVTITRANEVLIFCWLNKIRMRTYVPNKFEGGKMITSYFLALTAVRAI